MAIGIFFSVANHTGAVKTTVKFFRFMEQNANGTFLQVHNLLSIERKRGPCVCPDSGQLYYQRNATATKEFHQNDRRSTNHRPN